MFRKPSVESQSLSTPGEGDRQKRKRCSCWPWHLCKPMWHLRALCSMDIAEVWGVISVAIGVIILSCHFPPMSLRRLFLPIKVRSFHFCITSLLFCWTPELFLNGQLLYTAVVVFHSLRDLYFFSILTLLAVFNPHATRIFVCCFCF